MDGNRKTCLGRSGPCPWPSKLLGAVGWMVAFGTVFVGCSFDTTVGLETCSEEGRTRSGSVCRDGHWVPTDVAHTDVGGTPDGAPGPDTGNETAPDTDSEGSEMVDGGVADTDMRGDGDCDPASESCDDGASGCEPDATRSCYEGAEGTEGVGRCKAGTQVCGEDGEWSSCKEQKRPIGEQCGDGVDNDCDGTTDEAGTCRCNYESTTDGVCSRGKLDGGGNCEPPNAYESPESSCADGRDNDCDGAKDDEDEDCEEVEQQGPGNSCEEHEECLSRCIDGTCAHRVFVTSRKYKGDFGGLAGADKICNQRASAENAGGTWKAILSDSNTAARDRLSIEGPVVGWDGKLVADGKSDLWDGSIERPIEKTEENAKVHRRVWTGSNSDGTTDRATRGEPWGQYCEDWTQLEECGWLGCDSLDGETGKSSASDREWIVSEPDPDCDRQLHLYCIDGQ